MGTIICLYSFSPFNNSYDLRTGVPLLTTPLAFQGEGDWEIRGGLGVQRVPKEAEFLAMQR